MTSELKEAILIYANEDLDIAKENEQMCITGTKSGVVSIYFNDGFYQAFDKWANELTELLSREQMIDWVSNQYVIEY